MITLISKHKSFDIHPKLAIRPSAWACLPILTLILSPVVLTKGSIFVLNLLALPLAIFFLYLTFQEIVEGTKGMRNRIKIDLEHKKLTYKGNFTMDFVEIGHKILGSGYRYSNVGELRFFDKEAWIYSLALNLHDYEELLKFTARESDIVLTQLV